MLRHKPFLTLVSPSSRGGWGLLKNLEGMNRDWKLQWTHVDCIISGGRGGTITLGRLSVAVSSCLRP
eukprot:5269574-Amphidinium_carterae.1